MSGHSKWSQIKHKKAKLDAARGQHFTKLGKEITVAARLGGGDPNGNARLRQLIEKAKESNMPADNVARAIKKGTGELPGVQYEECLYEGYGPFGTALIIEVLTDNKNKAVATLRHFFSRKGGNLGEGGSVSWMFEKKGVVRIKKNSHTEDEILELLLDHDVDDISTFEETITISCNQRALDGIKQALRAANITIEGSGIEWIAKIPIALNEKESESLIEFLDALEDLEDIKAVYTNLA
jgi:YebC/PmpR family DNA-binding regulatory protein